MEYKSISFDLKAVSEEIAGDEWIIEGYASTYDLDLGKDMIQKGAFVKTIQQRFFDQKAYNGKSKIKILWQHDTEDLIGSLLDIREDEKGLYCRIQLFKDPVFVSAQKAYRLAKYGEIDSFSIGYKATAWEDIVNDDGIEVRIIKELKLFEISVVTFPMNEKAEFTNVKEEEFKSVNESKAIELLSEIKTMLEQFGNKLPELFAGKSTEVVELKEKPTCKDCGEQMKLMCPSCAKKSEVLPEVKETVPSEIDLKAELLSSLTAQFASLKDELANSLTEYINEKLVAKSAELIEDTKKEVSEKEETLKTETVVESVKENDAEPTELKLEDFIDFLLTKEFNL